MTEPPTTGSGAQARPRRRSKRYDPALGRELCRRLAGGLSLKQVCAAPDMPCVAAAYAWMDRHPEFGWLARASIDPKAVRRRGGDAYRHMPYAPDTAMFILAALADGHALTAACRDPRAGGAKPATVGHWRRTRPDFAALYEAARAEGAQAQGRMRGDGGGRVGRGRPSAYSPELAEEVIARLLEGRSLQSIGRDPDMPPSGTIKGWRKWHVEFNAAYTRARELQVLVLGEDVIAQTEGLRTASLKPRVVLAAVLRKRRS